MIPVINFKTEIKDDVLVMSRLGEEQYNVFDLASPGEIPTIVELTCRGKHRLASDGLLGAIVDGAPASATILVLQEHNGVYVEVGRVVTEDGSYDFNTLADRLTHVVAFKDGFNAGITANISPIE